jgi:hypothetical protein
VRVDAVGLLRRLRVIGAAGIITSGVGINVVVVAADGIGIIGVNNIIGAALREQRGDATNPIIARMSRCARTLPLAALSSWRRRTAWMAGIGMAWPSSITMVVR